MDDSATRSFYLSLFAHEREAGVVGQRVGQPGVAGQLGQVDQRDRVHALQVVAHLLAVLELRLAEPRA